MSYRDPADVDPEYKEPAWRRFKSWLGNHVPEILIGFIIFAVVGGIGFLIWWQECHIPAVLAEQLPARQERAEEWMQINGLEGSVHCRADSSVCDVILDETGNGQRTFVKIACDPHSCNL